MWTDKVLGLAISCGLVSTVFLFMSLFTDDWYIVDASAYRKQCRKDLILEQMYPWDDETFPATATPVHGNYNDWGTFHKVTMQIPLTLGDQTMSPLEKPYNDWPGMPLLSNRKRGSDPKSLTKRPENPMGRSSASSKEEDIAKSELNNKSFHLKVARWNGVIKKIQSNLRGFGGRDVTVDRDKSNLPTGTKADCTDRTQISTEIGPSQPCKSDVDCSLWQFSTRAGLWRRCLSNDGNSVLSDILEKGEIPRCASIRYSNVRKEDLPASLRAKEIDEAYREEWKALHLKRILVSFLCIAAPVQLFGVVIVISGWTIRRDFDIYAGGIVLVMSGTFQLFAIWTSGLLLELELARKPATVYSFPKGVTQKFGSSAHALWLSSGNTLFCGLLCAVIPSVFSVRRRKEGNIVSTHAIRSLKESCEDGRDSDSVDVMVQIKSALPSLAKKNVLERQTCSCDTGSYLMEPLIPSQRLEDTPRKSKTCSTPNLRDLDQQRRLTGGPSTIGRLRRSSVTVAPTGQPMNSTTSEPDSAEMLHNTNASFDQRNLVSRQSIDRSLSQRSMTLLRMSSRRSLRSLRSLSKMSPMNESDLSCWQTVEISQMLRHTRYARRTSRSHEEAVSRIQQIMRGDSMEEQRRTKSLPRPAMRQTLSTETPRDLNGKSRQDQCDIGPSGSETIVPRTRGRAAYLSSLARNYSDDVSTKRARLVHPQIVKLSQDGSILSRSSDSSRSYLNRSLSHESSRSYVLEREATLDSVRECSESGHTSSSEESLMKNSLTAVRTVN